MGGEHAIAEVESGVVEIFDVGVAFPVKANEVAGQKLIQRKNFLGPAAADENGVDEPARARLSVGGRDSTGNGQTAAAQTGLAADAGGNEMGTIITNGTGGRGRAGRE